MFRPMSGRNDAWNHLRAHDGRPVDALEATRRRVKYEQISAAQARDAVRLDETANPEATRAERAAEHAPILAALQAGGSAAHSRPPADNPRRTPGSPPCTTTNGP